MIGLDTNILVRYFAQDEPRQARAASRLLESLTPENPGMVANVVLAETVWVIEDVYSMRREEIAAIVEKLLQMRSIVLQNAEEAWQALSRYRGGATDFVDCLIERVCASFGADATYTFDRKAARQTDARMRLLG